MYILSVAPIISGWIYVPATDFSPLLTKGYQSYLPILLNNPIDCDPSCPDIYIPPPPTDLDCGEIPHRRFQVLPPDPHNFEGDGDGIGCESG